jgi:HD-GYP domain-containing protein (c-di-GMP phosphodiesterase class II)
MGLENVKEGILSFLVETGRIFSSNKDFSVIFQELMERTRYASGAEGGSLFIYDRNSEQLKIVVMANEPLGISKVVESFDPLRINGFINIPIRDGEGKINLRNASIRCFSEGVKHHIPDLDTCTEFDLTNTRNFDKSNNYKTRNISVFPLYGHNIESAIGVLQLVNCDPSVTDPENENFYDALIWQVGMALNSALLVNELQRLLSSLVEMVVVAIDEKSPHTAGHCQRVTELTMMIADALCEEKEGPYADFFLTIEEKRELRMAALLHDVGKVVTPSHVMEKSTKLHTFNDRVQGLYDRLRAWRLSKRLRFIEARLRENGQEHLLEDLPEIPYQEDFDFIEKVNRADVFMDEEAVNRLEDISSRMIEFGAIQENDHQEPIIQGRDLKNLQIKRGTLNEEEWKIMRDHVSVSIRLLSSIPWPYNMRRIVEYAGAHHENLDGSGYPNGLTGNQMSLPALILGLADRFEGLSAPDRPYRKTKMTLSRAMNILEDMSAKKEIDSELFDFFKTKKIHIEYAKLHLPEDLIDCD